MVLHLISHVTLIYYVQQKDIPFSCEASPPSAAAGSNDVPRTVKTFTLSLDLIVVTALPKWYMK